jgi:hypothetical protein
MTLFRSLDSAPRRLLLLDVGPAVAQCAFFCVEKSGVEGIVIKVCTTMTTMSLNVRVFMRLIQGEVCANITYPTFPAPIPRQHEILPFLPQARLLSI